MYRNPADPRSLVYVSNADPKLGVERNWAHPGLRFWALCVVSVAIMSLLIASLFVNNGKVLGLVGNSGLFLVCIIRALNLRDWTNEELARHPGAPGHRGADGVSAAEESEPMTFTRQLMNRCLLIAAVILVLIAAGSLLLYFYKGDDTSEMFLFVGVVFVFSVLGVICVASGLYHDGIMSGAFFAGLMFLGFAGFVVGTWYWHSTGVEAYFLSRDQLTGVIVKRERVRFRNLSEAVMVLDDKRRIEKCYYATKGDVAYLVVGHGVDRYSGDKPIFEAFPVARGQWSVELRDNGMLVRVFADGGEGNAVSPKWYSLFSTNGLWTVSALNGN